MRQSWWQRVSPSYNQATSRRALPQRLAQAKAHAESLRLAPKPEGRSLEGSPRWAFSAVFRVIFHLDMDAFYASVEQRDNPALRGKPVIVGAPPTQRGVVCAASYEARKFGVRSAMPSVTAGRLCPAGVFVRPRMEHYRQESHQIMNVVAQTGAVIEQVSIDEAYLDVTALCQGEDADASLLKSVSLARDLKAG